MKKILPINENIKVNSYVQHSYVNSIIARTDIARLYVRNLGKWDINKGDIAFTRNGDIAICEETEGRISSEIELIRKGSICDEVIVGLEDIKLTDSLSSVTVGVREAGEKEQNLFSYSWNQYDVTIGENKYVPRNHFNAYYKLRVNENGVQIFVSENADEWTILYTGNQQIDKSMQRLLYIKLYFGRNQFEEWRQMNYINLFYSDKDPNGINLDYYMFPRKLSDAGYQCYCHFIDTEYVDFNKIHRICGIGINKYVKESINLGYYVNISINEFFVPSRRAYGREKYMHYNLIYGFDDEKGIYYILGYNEIGKLTKSIIDYRTLKSARDVKQEIVRYIYKVNKYEYRFNPTRLVSDLRAFLTSKDLGARYGHLLTDRTGVFGISIFDAILDSADGKVNFFSDKRISYLIYEHSCLMQERILYLAKRGYVCEEEKILLMEKSKEIVAYTEQIKNLVIMNSVRYLMDKSRVFALLKKVREKERELFETIICDLQGGEILDDL